MKTNLTNIIFFVTLLLIEIQATAQGYIVPNGVTFGGYESGIVNGYRINVIDNPSGTPSIWSTNTQFFLSVIGMTEPTVYPNTFSFSEYLDVGVRVFIASSNQPFSLAQVVSQSFTELDHSSPGYVFNHGSPFYLALYSGYQFAPPYIFPRTEPIQYLGPVFGWVKLQNLFGTIQFLDGALEYGGAGIYIGTQNIIQPSPEPGTLALAALGGLLLGFRRRRVAW
jgi:hypothetical protein